MLERSAIAGGLDGAALFAPLSSFARIGLAVSGGPDSLALMLLMADWAEGTDKTLVVYTVDHGLRPEAAAECALVADDAARLGLACRTLHWTGPKPDTGIQAAARTARYRLIGEAMRADGTEVLVTAHHVNDQAETLLMRMAHGSGLSGLAGMALFGEVEGVRICRPLLSVEPTQLRSLVREAGLTAVADPSNTDEHYERVRWRHTLPVLAREGLDADRFAAMARRLARADAALTAVAEEARACLASVDRFGVVSLPHDELFDLPEEVGLRVLDHVVGWAGGSERVRLGALETACDALRAGDPGFATTLGGAAIMMNGAAVLIFREIGRMPDPGAFSLDSGATLIFDGRFTIRSTGEGGDILSITRAGEALTRAEAEALIGPIEVPMRAVAAAPVVRDNAGRLKAIGATRELKGLEIGSTFRA